MHNYKKYDSLNFIKFIACFAVVMLHCSFPGIVGKILYGFSRFAVPFFFMISGYFFLNSYSIDVRSRVEKKIKHILQLLVYSEVIYLIWHIIEHACCKDLIEWVKETFTLKAVFELLIFQKTMLGDVSWFLVALILCYIAGYIINKYSIWNKIFVLIPFLLGINIFLSEIIPFMTFKATRWIYCSNFWLMGLPFFLIGVYIYKNQNWKDKISHKLFWISISCCLIMNVLERVLTEGTQIFASNIFMAVLIFLYGLKYSTFTGKNSKILYVLAEWGSEYSLGVYILHPIIRDLLTYFARLSGLNTIELWNWLLPVLVFIISILVFRLKKYLKLSIGVTKKLD